METFTVPPADLADLYSVVPYNVTDEMPVVGYGGNETVRPTPVRRKKKRKRRNLCKCWSDSRAACVLCVTVGLSKVACDLREIWVFV